MTRTRSIYTEEDDMSMIRFLLEEGYLTSGHMGFSINVWKKAQRKGVTHHTAESMRNRFRRYLLKNFARLKRSVITEEDDRKRVVKPISADTTTHCESPVKTNSPICNASLSSQNAIEPVSPQRDSVSCISEVSCAIGIDSNPLPSEQAKPLLTLNTRDPSEQPQPHSLPYALYSFLHYVYQCFGVSWNDILQLLQITDGVPQKILTVLSKDTSLVETLRTFPGEILYPPKGFFYPFSPVIRVGSSLPEEVLNVFKETKDTSCTN